MAMSIQVMCIHLLGDAISPSIIGILIDWKGYQFAMLINTLMLIPMTIFWSKGLAEVRATLADQKAKGLLLRDRDSDDTHL